MVGRLFFVEAELKSSFWWCFFLKRPVVGGCLSLARRGTVRRFGLRRRLGAAQDRFAASSVAALRVGRNRNAGERVRAATKYGALGAGSASRFLAASAPRRAVRSSWLLLGLVLSVNRKSSAFCPRSSWIDAVGFQALSRVAPGSAPREAEAFFLLSKTTALQVRAARFFVCVRRSFYPLSARDGGSGLAKETPSPRKSQGALENAAFKPLLPARALRLRGACALSGVRLAVLRRMGSSRILQRQQDGPSEKANALRQAAQSLRQARRNSFFQIAIGIGCAMRLRCVRLSGRGRLQKRRARK